MTRLRHILITAAAILLAATASAQTGTWSGSLNVSGMELTLIFHLSENTDSTSTLDVPDQGASDIPVNVSRTAIGGITLDIPSIGATFKGTWTGKSIIGSFTQMGSTLPLSLKSGAPVLKRPQTPMGPFPYSSEEVSFTNGSATLRGTLTLPEGYTEQTPALIMVTGSGLQNRDEEIFSHKPFAVIADALSRAGIATLRYDDRGFGESTGDIVNCTTEDLKDDALAGVELLRQRFSKVGVLGHSEGGSIALMLAAEGKADFAVSLAGMIVSGAETLLWQNRRALENSGIGKADTDSYCRLLSEAYEAVTDGLPLPSADKYGLPDSLKQNYLATSAQLNTPYLKYFLALNVSSILNQIKVPVLALNGSKDTQVESARNLGALRAGLRGGSHNVIEEKAGLNHLFQHCRTGEASEYKTIEETFSPEVLDEIAAWVTSAAR